MDIYTMLKKIIMFKDKRSSKKSKGMEQPDDEGLEGPK